MRPENGTFYDGTAALNRYRLPEWSTRFASSSVKRNFEKVRIGASVDEVYQQLERPFYATVVSNGVNARVAYDSDVSPGHLRVLMLDKCVSVWLEYSKNNGLSGKYNRFGIELRDSKVARILQDQQD